MLSIDMTGVLLILTSYVCHTPHEAVFRIASGPLNYAYDVLRRRSNHLPVANNTNGMSLGITLSKLKFPVVPPACTGDGIATQQGASKTIAE